MKWIRVAAAVAIAMAAGVLVTSPAQAQAGGTLRVKTVQCVEETDEVGDDSPYYVAFAVSPTNPNATAFGKWGPGALDVEVASGETHNPNGVILGGIPAGWTLITLMLEEDSANDLSATDRQNIDNGMYNQYQISFWKPKSTMLFEMQMALIFLTGSYLENDDVVASGTTTVSTAGSWVYYDGDGGRYWVNYKLN